jgi:hypothetical protein
MRIWCLVGALALGSLLGCAQEEAEMEESVAVAQDAAAPAPAEARAALGEPAAPAAAGAGAPAASPGPAAAQGRKLIRTVELELAVKDTEAAARRVQEIVGTQGGFVESMGSQRTNDLMFYTMTLRLPNERLDVALAAIRELAVRVEREQLGTEDATSRYVDLQSQLRNLQTTEAELRELLAESREKGRKVADIMEVYRELTGIRGQIEMIQGQLQSIDRLAALSTLNLQLRPDVAARPIVQRDEWRPIETVRGSLRVLLSIVQFLVNAFIVAVLVVLPIALPLWLLFRWLRRRKPQGSTPEDSNLL